MTKNFFFGADILATLMAGFLVYVGHEAKKPIANVYSADVASVTAGDIESLKAKAALGDKEAQYKLAVAYDLGQGAKQDFPEAAIWMEKAAKQGFSKAEILYGLMYTKGEGVPRDKISAYMWLSFAADQGDKDAKAMLDMYSKLLNKSEIAMAQKRGDDWKMDNH